MKFDIIGIGAGPANLSLAALLTGAIERGVLKARPIFFERQDRYRWHSRQMFPGTLMQNEFFRDLVTAIDPTSRFSFLNYLRDSGRLMQFINSGIVSPQRREYEDYFRWAIRNLPSVVLGHEVLTVDFDDATAMFVAHVKSADGTRAYMSRNISLAPGPVRDQRIVATPDQHIFHVSTLLHRSLPISNTRVLIIGGGQSAAECVQYLIARPATKLRITWVTAGAGFRSLDTGNFAREAYSAAFASRINALTAGDRDRINRDLKHIAVGISPDLTQQLYQSLYYLKYFPDANAPSVQLMANTVAEDVRRQGSAIAVRFRSNVGGSSWEEHFDDVILCTGFLDPKLGALSHLTPTLRSRVSGEEIRPDYSLSWVGPEDRRLFIQSGSAHSHGLTELNYVVAAARNATIINSMFGEQIYRVDVDDSLVELQPIPSRRHTPRV